MSIRTGLVGLLLIGACSTGHVDSTLPLSRPEPSPPATGPTVATLVDGDTTFALHDEGESCLALAIDHLGLQSTVERECFGGERVVEVSASCGWLATDEPPDGCDVTLPIVFFGQVREPGIGFVCVGTAEAARFISFDSDGFILEEAHAGERGPAYLFTVGGLRYGQPPTDGPADSIYRLCEEQAPWGSTEVEITLPLVVYLGDSLRADDVTLWFDAGTGPLGLSGSAAEGGAIVGPVLRVPTSSAGLGISIEVEGQPTVEAFVGWPNDLLALVDADTQCRMGAQLRVDIGDAARTGDADAITVQVLTPNC